MPEQQLEADSQYEQGYRDGESSQLADWEFALTEWCKLPDDVDRSPTAVARYIAKLQAVTAEVSKNIS